MGKFIGLKPRCKTQMAICLEGNGVVEQALFCERKRKNRKPGLTAKGEIPAIFKNLDVLPDTVSVRQPVVEAMFACSGATVWRWVRKGILPVPDRMGRISSWPLGELRAVRARGAKGRAR